MAVKVCISRMPVIYDNHLFYKNPYPELVPGGGVHNMFRVRVCAAHMGGFLGPKFSKQGSLFRQIFHKQGWVIQKLAKNSKKWVVFRQSLHKSGYDGNVR